MISKGDVLKGTGIPKPISLSRFNVFSAYLSLEGEVDATDRLRRVRVSSLAMHRL